MKELKYDDYNINEVSDELDNDRLSFKEIYPKKLNRKKSHYIDSFGEDNEMKKFINLLPIEHLKLKDNLIISYN
jgi:hypothetical protein